MKERPVIFNSEMVRAILDGRKTQTRRTIANVGSDNCIPLQKPTKTKDGIYTHVMDAPGNGLCPFGQIGDRLWVRETFAILGNEDGCPIDWDGNLIKGDEKHAARIYKASCWQEPGNYGLWSIPDRDTQYEGTWRPSIHMPRWASRITLEITAVRVERLNDISEEDAKAEGVKAGVSPGHEHMMHQVAFSELWQSIYGAENWSANPWVWVIEFKHVEVRDASK
ncbi:hypothetical protein ACTVNX_16255 [Serratia nevei]|uniref:hypothetical protein n=1 Tax=Serratia nevei TaxID=2703794 RepID=UPI0018D84602|nr:hypothetical protein [Serratia marcescens]MBI6131443.1 hypothetical protein [Serratia marcescens]MBN5304143.1 hypothetical protein [Serratia marcescens]